MLCHINISINMLDFSVFAMKLKFCNISVVYRAKAAHDGRTVALKKVQIFEMMDSKVL